MLLKSWHVACFAVLFAVGPVGISPAAKADDHSDAMPTTTASANPVTEAAPAAAGKPILWCIAQKPAHRQVVPGVPNFGELNDYVWRSGQPTRRGYENLAAMHLKTVVNLRKEFPQDKDLLPKGVKYFYIPITDQTAPTEEDVKQFLQIVTNPDNWPVLVHCQGGQGRAGVMSAMVRYSIDGWDEHRINQEISNFHQPIFIGIKLRMCDSQCQLIQKWESENKPGAYMAQITAPHPAQQTGDAADVPHVNGGIAQNTAPHPTQP